MPAPYKRGYHHTKSKGHESKVVCGYCGRQVPRWKTIASYRGFSINDPTLRKQIDRRFVSTFETKSYACPACARYRGIVKPRQRQQNRQQQW